MAVASPLKGGKTTPRLLQDLRSFDPAAADLATNVLTSVPFHDASQEEDPPLLSSHCEHRWLLKKSQSVTKGSETNRVTDSADSKISSVCANCRCHLEISIQTDAVVSDANPCPSADYPLHHFVFDGAISTTGTDKLDEIREKGGQRAPKCFHCSAPSCPTNLLIQYRPPRLKSDWVSLLTDKYIIKSRAERAIASDPERFQGHVVPSRAAVLEHFYRTVDRVLREAKGAPYPQDGKKFMLNFGESCTPIFEALGFTSDGSLWHWPSLSSGVDIPYDEPQEILLDDVREEVVALLLNLRYDEKQSVRFDIVPLPAIDTVKNALGDSDYQRTPRAQLEDPNAPEHPFYASLGSIADFHDDLIYFAYQRQTMTDPENTPYFLEALQTIAGGRGSEALITKAAIEESQGRISLEDIRKAYKNLGIHFQEEIHEHNIIGVFNARITDSPKQEAQLRRDLKIIGIHRGSEHLQSLAAQSVNTYEQALSYIGADPSDPDEFIPTHFTVKINDKPGEVETARQAVALIARERKSEALRQWLDTGKIGEVAMDINHAYARLGIDDRSMEDDNIIALFQVRVDEQPSQADELKAALRTIASERSSQALKDLAGIGRNEAVFPVDKWPVGLNNIGNTCYLNSLLQYYFSVKPFRDLILDIAQYKSPITEGAIKSKRIGGRVVSKKEVEVAQRLAEELRKLFNALISSADRSVRPDTEVARLTLLTPKAEIARRNSIRQSMSNTKPPDLTQILSQKEKETVDQSALVESSPVDDTTRQPGAPSEENNHKTTGTSNSSDETLVDNVVGNQGSPASTDNQEKQRNGSTEPQQPDEHVDKEMSGAVEQNEGKIGTQTNAVIEKQSEGNIPKSPRSQPPPVPPRPVAVNDQQEAVKEAEFAAQQQDVHEIAYNILNQLQCAIQPQAFDKAGEQLDQVTTLFYGKQKTYITNQAGKVRETEEYMSDIKINVQGDPIDIYAALDGAFDVEDVDVAGGIEPKHSTISQLPPILQIHIQRGQYDSQAKKQFKSNTHLAIKEIIHMDRYMDSSDPELLQQRKQSWEWKRQLSRLETRKGQLLAPDLGMAMSEVLECAQTYLQQLQGIKGNHSIEVPPNLFDALGEAAREARDELSSVETSIQDLQSRISTQFEHLDKIAYRIAAVFIHRGSSSAGHYWIYIYDFSANVWRKYNDETVTLVEDSREIFDAPTDPRPPTPYFLVYVKDDEKHNLIDPLCRNVTNKATDMTEDIEMDGQEPEGHAAGAEAHKISNVATLSGTKTPQTSAWNNSQNLEKSGW